MSIELKGHILNQRQLDAITPVMNDYMHGKIKGHKKLEAAMVAALDAAGCPLGYDAGLDRPGTVQERAQNWIVSGRVGQSSKAIWTHMMGVTVVPDGFGTRYPLDPDDLNRCLMLLDRIPEWAPRMHEMATYSQQWAGLAANWDEISQCFLDEVGLNWCKGKSAPRTYELMKAAIGEEPGAVRLGAMTIRTA